jgi:hypothetical protein
VTPVPPFLWFDAAPIARRHDEIVEADAELGDHVRLIHETLALLDAVVRYQPPELPARYRTVLRLAIRTFNDGGAALTLGRDGYFQQAFSLVRDILELEFLVDLFARDPAALDAWIGADDRTRRHDFNPAVVRKKLDEMDGFTDMPRQKEYDLFSVHAAHANPTGFSVISTGETTETGPFVSCEVLTALLQELAKHLPAATVHFMRVLEPAPVAVGQPALRFRKARTDWRQRYLS